MTPNDNDAHANRVSRAATIENLLPCLSDKRAVKGNPGLGRPISVNRSNPPAAPHPRTQRVSDAPAPRLRIHNARVQTPESSVLTGFSSLPVTDGAVRAREGGAAQEPPRQVPVRGRGRGARDAGPGRVLGERAVDRRGGAAQRGRRPPAQPLRALPHRLRGAVPAGDDGAEGDADGARRAAPRQRVRGLGAPAGRLPGAPPHQGGPLPPRQRGAPALEELGHPRRAPPHRHAGLGALGRRGRAAPHARAAARAHRLRARRQVAGLAARAGPRQATAGAWAAPPPIQVLRDATAHARARGAAAAAAAAVQAQ
jgi:hypothetical protein